MLTWFLAALIGLLSGIALANWWHGMLHAGRTPEARVLWAIGHGECYAFSIASLLGLSSGALYPILVRLERQGVIMRAFEAGPEPRRVQYRLIEDSQPGDRELTETVMVPLLGAAMEAKLARARANGRGGWERPEECSVTHLWDCLHEHIHKDNLDMVDVANLAGMVRWRLQTVPGDREQLAAHVTAQREGGRA